jgi:large subunit ribosomal protein L14
MIQKGSYLNVSDNSGAKKVSCIHIYESKKKVAKVGDIILVSIKALRSSKRLKLKIKKGEIYKALVLRSKMYLLNNCIYSTQVSFFENSVILLDKKNKLIGSRVIGPVPKFFKYTKYSRICSLASGVI